MEFYLQRSAMDANGAAAVSGQAEASFLDWIAASGGGGGGESVQAWFTNAVTFRGSAFQGGSGTPTNPDTWFEWTKSIPQVRAAQWWSRCTRLVSVTVFGDCVTADPSDDEVHGRAHLTAAVQPRPGRQLRPLHTRPHGTFDRPAGCRMLKRGCLKSLLQHHRDTTHRDHTTHRDRALLLHRTGRSSQTASCPRCTRFYLRTCTCRRPGTRCVAAA